jgi:hypothetical protein
MASLEIISSNCKEPDCERRATRRLLNKDGAVIGEYCKQHADKAHVELSRAEGGRGRA